MANVLFTRRYNTNLRQRTVIATISIFKSLSIGSYKITAISGGGDGGFYGGFAEGGNGGSVSVNAENGTDGVCIVQYFHY